MNKDLFAGNSGSVLVDGRLIYRAMELWFGFDVK